MFRDLGNNIWISSDQITTSQLCVFLITNPGCTKLYYNKGKLSKLPDDVIYEHDVLYTIKTLDCVYSRETLSPPEALKYVNVRNISDLLLILNKKIKFPGNLTTTKLKITWRHILIGDFDIKYDFIANLPVFLEIAIFIQNNFLEYKRLRPFTESLINYIPDSNLQYYRKPPTIYLEIMKSGTSRVLPIFSTLELESAEKSSDNTSDIYKLIFVR